MKNKKLQIGIISVLVLASVAFYIYRSYFSYKTTESGLKYRFIEGEQANQPRGEGWYCLMNYMIVGPKGDTIVSSYSADTLMEIPYPTEAKNELTEALMLATEGSKVEVLLSTDSLKLKNSGDYKVQLLPDGEQAKVIFDLEKVISAQAYFKYLAEKSFKRTMAENKAIDDYSEKIGGQWYLDTFTMVKYRVQNIQDTDSSYWSQPNVISNAPYHKASRELEFDAQVKTLGGTLIFDSYLENRKYKSDYYGMIQPIKALNVLPFYVKEGVEVEFLVTSDMAFGPQGRIGVPPYTPVYIKIYNVKPIK